MKSGTYVIMYSVSVFDHGNTVPSRQRTARQPVASSAH